VRCANNGPLRSGGAPAACAIGAPAVEQSLPRQEPKTLRATAPERRRPRARTARARAAPEVRCSERFAVRPAGDETSHQSSVSRPAKLPATSGSRMASSHSGFRVGEERPLQSASLVGQQATCAAEAMKPALECAAPTSRVDRIESAVSTDRASSHNGTASASRRAEASSRTKPADSSRAERCSSRTRSAHSSVEKRIRNLFKPEVFPIREGLASRPGTTSSERNNRATSYREATAPSTNLNQQKDILSRFRERPISDPIRPREYQGAPIRMGAPRPRSP
jgi:hypothetical protein